MNDATLFGAVVLLFLVPLAAMFLGWTLVRARAGDRRRWRSALALGAAVLLVVAALVVAGWAIPDDGDDLTESERSALDASLECGALPFARVIDVERTPYGLRYTCGLTPFGLPRLSGAAECADGTWRVPGVLQEQSGGSCRG